MKTKYTILFYDREDLTYLVELTNEVVYNVIEFKTLESDRCIIINLAGWGGFNTSEYENLSVSPGKESHAKRAMEFF